MSLASPRLRLFFLLCAIGSGAALACGAAPNYYKRSITKQETCCANVQNPDAKNACLAEIKRADSDAVAESPTNQETFSCVDRYFECDPATGTATRESAQAQLDCLNDLESSGQQPPQ